MDGLRVKLQTDGGSRGNPGIAGIGFSIADISKGPAVSGATSSASPDDGSIICRGGWYIGKTTNNVAEYTALIWGLENALELGATHVDIRADSELMVRQIQGAYKVKNAGLKPLYEQAKRLLGRFGSYTVEHVYREENSLPDSLANKAMDTLNPVGDYVLPHQTGELFAGF